MAGARLFVDTNVFLRFLTGDDAGKAEECRRLLERAESGEFDLFTNDMVVAELVWTLRSYYRLPKQEIVDTLRDLLAMRSIRTPRKGLLREAVELYGRHDVDFIDAYNALDCRRRRVERVCSYDRDFDMLGYSRVEPGQL